MRKVPLLCDWPRHGDTCTSPDSPSCSRRPGSRSTCRERSSGRCSDRGTAPCWPTPGTRSGPPGPGVSRWRPSCRPRWGRWGSTGGCSHTAGGYQTPGTPPYYLHHQYTGEKNVAIYFKRFYIEKIDKIELCWPDLVNRCTKLFWSRWLRPRLNSWVKLTHSLK